MKKNKNKKIKETYFKFKIETNAEIQDSVMVSSLDANGILAVYNKHINVCRRVNTYNVC
jgi:hypothetical protein